MLKPQTQSYISYELAQEPLSAPAAFYPAVLIVQARMGSTRLPGKVLLELEGKSLLHILAERLRSVKSIDAFCIATTHLRSDDAIADFCNRQSLHCYRGESEDVLARYYGAAKGFDAEVVVRITADCPFIDPRLIDRALFCFKNHYDEIDFLSNTLLRTYPRGMDIEIMKMTALEDAFYHAGSRFDKEHVTPYIKNHSKYRLGNFFQKEDSSHIRVTVDTEEDLRFLDALYARLSKDSQFLLEDILKIVQKEPQILNINAHVEQRS